ncbi:hypothetical protein Tco_0227660 [Tanacetum coccineum]
MKKISNLKSQACKKEKSFQKENEKYAEYVQSLLKRKNELEKTNQEFLKQINDLDNKLRKTGQTAQTLHTLLPKEDSVNTGKQGLGFENLNDVENPFVLNKAKELAPSLYDIDKMEQDVIARNRLSGEFEPLVKEVNLQLNCFEKGLVKEMKDDLNYVTSLDDEFDEKSLILDIQKEFFKTRFESTILESHSHYEKDFAKQEAHCISLEIKSQNQSLTSMQNGHVLKEQSDDATIKFDLDEVDTKNIELKHAMASLHKENEHLNLTYPNLFDSIKRSRVQKKSSNVTQNVAENLKSQLSEFGDKKFDKVFQKAKSMKKKMFDSPITSDFL